MSKRIKTLITLALIAGYAMSAYAMGYAKGLEQGSTPTPQACFEDMPCWDCETMGNKICGPDANYPTLYHTCTNGICITSLTKLDQE